jgi:phosphatidylglycerol:prolipoprotein diacylglycerol transferase
VPTPDDAYPYLGDVVEALTGVDLPLPMPMFGFFVLVALVVATVALRSELRRRFAAGELLDPDRHRPGSPSSRTELDEFTTGFAAAMLLAGIAGAKLFSVLEDPGALVRDPVGRVFSSNGFNIIGGLVVATAVGVVMIRRKGLRVAPFLDAAAPALMLGYAVGRIGCQVSGDGDWGVAADLAAKPGWVPTWLWAQQYEGNVLGVTIPAPGVYPTPIWETVMCLVLFAVLWALRRQPFRAGWLFSLYLVLAAVERLLIEPVRVNDVHGPLALSQAQYLSALFLVVGLVGLVRFRARAAGSGAPATEAGASAHEGQPSDTA